jgi:hypothetical protein
MLAQEKNIPCSLSMTKNDSARKVLLWWQHILPIIRSSRDAISSYALRHVFSFNGVLILNCYSRSTKIIYSIARSYLSTHHISLACSDTKSIDQVHGTISFGSSGTTTTSLTPTSINLSMQHLFWNTVIPSGLLITIVASQRISIACLDSSFIKGNHSLLLTFIHSYSLSFTFTLTLFFFIS